MNTNLVNAVPADVEFTDGTTETITITKLEIEPLYKWCRFVSEKNSPALVRLCTGKPAEFFSNATRKVKPSSFALLAKQCIELNFPSALELLEDPMIATLLGPVLSEMAIMATSVSQEKLEQAIAAAKQQVTRGTPSGDSSASPQPTASALEASPASAANTP
jgi:hypothetical protein